MLGYCGPGRHSTSRSRGHEPETLSTHRGDEPKALSTRCLSSLLAGQRAGTVLSLWGLLRVVELTVGFAPGCAWTLLFCQPHDHGDNGHRDYPVVECHPTRSRPCAAPNRTRRLELCILPPPTPCRAWQGWQSVPSVPQPRPFIRGQARPAPPRTLAAHVPYVLLFKVKNHADDLFNKMGSALLSDKDTSIVTKRNKQ